MRLLERPGDAPKRRAEPVTKQDRRAERGRRILCSTCSHAITTTAARTEVTGSHRHTFCNPHGLVFDIGCFRQAPGAAAVGDPSDFFSWFPGLHWRVGVCRNCKTHLGWAFGTAGPPEFWGLIMDRLEERDDDA